LAIDDGQQGVDQTPFSKFVENTIAMTQLQLLSAPTVLQASRTSR
jgi:hypothetical protein